MTIGLLDRNYVNSDDIGDRKWKLSYILNMAWGKIEFKWKNIDKIIIYFSILSALVILLFYFITLAMYFVITPSFAAMIPTAINVFITPSPDTDIAYMLLNNVFGIPGMFGNTATTNSFHLGLQSLLSFYSGSLFLFAVIIFLYFIVKIIGQVAITGQPISEEFNPLWTPIRLFIAIGLLLPISDGLNGAQFFVLSIAKMGSSLATNAWIEYNGTITTQAGVPSSPYKDQVNILGVEKVKLLARPEHASIDPFLKFMYLIQGCKKVYKKVEGTEPKMYVTFDNGESFDDYEKIMDSSSPFDLDDISESRGDIIFTVGYERAGPTQYKNNIDPVCGQIIIEEISVGNEKVRTTANLQLLVIVWLGWYDNDTANISYFTHRIVELEWPDNDKNGCVNEKDGFETDPFDPSKKKEELGPCHKLPSSTVLVEDIAWLRDVHTNYKREWIYSTMIEEYDIDNDLAMIDRGWAGAGVWFNRLAQYNGDLVSLFNSVPRPLKYPSVMEYVQKERMKKNSRDESINRFDPVLPGGEDTIDFSDNPKNSEVATVLNAIFVYWNVDDTTLPANKVGDDQNPLSKVINIIFGTSGIFSLRNNQDVHPLAAISSAGKSLVEASIRNMMAGIGLSAMGGFMDVVNGEANESVASALASSMFTISGITLSIGFFLYYILPILPFMYFFFAVGDWVKSIFEALIGVPLWAIAHLSIEGDDFMSEKAADGYMLIFEIFLRPILTLFALMASVSVFAALVSVFNMLFDMPASNFMASNDTMILIGFDAQGKPMYDALENIPAEDLAGSMTSAREKVDQLFITILYSIIVYVMALNSFKLIDSIPDGILRWIGGGTKSFSDISGDPAEKLTEYAAIGSNMMMGSAQQGLASLGKGMGSVAGALKLKMDRQESLTDKERQQMGMFDGTGVNTMGLPNNSGGGMGSGGNNP